jgi:dihydroorotate dehydrogenase electron transfer subunit
MFQIKAKLISNKRIKNDYWHAVLNAPLIAKSARPGQFVNVKASNDLEPFLRRPFSIHRAQGVKIEILYEVVGPGTQILSQNKAGECLDIIGPLGNDFEFNRQADKRRNRQTILVAGGMGVAPLVFLAEKLNKEVTVLIGAKTKNQILCEKEFIDLGCHVKIATDDGSAGFKGKVTDLLKSILRTTHDAQRTTLYACGPRPMLKEIANLSQRYKIPAQISLEEHMACGIGACLGCVVNTKDGYQRVCKEGPVFEANQISL